MTHHAWEAQDCCQSHGLKYQLSSQTKLCKYTVYILRNWDVIICHNEYEVSKHFIIVTDQSCKFYNISADTCLVAVHFYITYLCYSTGNGLISPQWLSGQDGGPT